jgi:predicted dehydrogenase
MANKIYKAAVIGCGNIGAAAGNYNKTIQPATHAGAYSANKKTKLVGLAENNKERWPYLEKHYPGIKIYSDIGDMLNEARPDIVSISTPTKNHYENVLQAAQFGCKAILCEKPIATNVKDVLKMIDVCKKSGSLLFINHTRHFDPVYQRCGARIKNGIIGQIYQGNIYYYNGLFNNGTHLLDLIRLFLGDPVSIEARYNKTTYSSPEDLNVDGILTFKNNANITLQSLSKNYGFFNIRLFGEKGMIDVNNLLYEVIYKKKIKNKNFKGFYELSSAEKKEGRVRSVMTQPIKHIISCLEGKAKPISTGEDGLAVLRILLALKQGADKHGREILLK